ncbi:thermonuclease family protein [Achromobacter aloeverae]|uniref:Nuclease n=1 Tax=Achromobacter aloeverae TaxID=1750518 RepID=A0A4Q1HQ86_9BURK|nr:thermonuclease family protein [Achromobacter aloeverae]RXN93228.1 nuclease [Achromobacter aloeverae]
MLTSGLLRTLFGRVGLARPVGALACALAAAGVAYLSSSHAPQRNEGVNATYELRGRVVNVADGDTVTLQTDGGQRRVRLASIDAPEVGHGQVKPGQPFGQAARKSLEGMVAGRTLTAKCYEKDQYARDVCDLPGDGGHTVNWQQVDAGYAWANTARHGEYLRDATLPAVERKARDQRKGLWAQAGAIAPWEWRYQCWNHGKCAAADATPASTPTPTP